MRTVLGVVVGSRRRVSRVGGVGSRRGVVVMRLARFVAGISGMMIGIVLGIRDRSMRVAIGVRVLRGRIVGLLASRRHRGDGDAGAQDDT